MAIEVRDRLQALRDNIAKELVRNRTELAVELESRGEDITPSQHPADVASDRFVRDTLLTTERRLSVDLSAVEDGLRRAREGTYGICAECGRPIAKERLEVLPRAVRGVECQRLDECARARN
jgi:DnaK suppressor protein